MVFVCSCAVKTYTLRPTQSLNKRTMTAIWYWFGSSSLLTIRDHRDKRRHASPNVCRRNYHEYRLGFFVSVKSDLKHIHTGWLFACFHWLQLKIEKRCETKHECIYIEMSWYFPSDCANIDYEHVTSLTHVFALHRSCILLTTSGPVLPMTDWAIYRHQRCICLLVGHYSQTQEGWYMVRILACNVALLQGFSTCGPRTSRGPRGASKGSSASPEKWRPFIF